MQRAKRKSQSVRCQNVAKLVLVSIGVNVRTVSFSTPASSQPATITEIQALNDAIRISFEDVLQPGQEFFLQLKSEDWGGEFIDLQGTQEIADRSVVRAVIKPVTEVRKLDKKVLVSMRENTRPVSFSTVVTDTEPLMKAVQVTFSDVLQPGQDFFLQVKCEEWEGAFVDLVGSQEIADRSLIRAVIKPAPEVKKLEKVVLVSMGVNTRHVSFSTAESVTDTEALMQAIRTTFKDNLQSGQEFSLQLKSEEWGGEFIDLQGTQEIADRSVVRAKPRPLTLTEEASIPSSKQLDLSSSTELALPSEVLLEDTTWEFHLGLNDLNIVFQTIYDADMHWYDIGLQLGLSVPDLKRIAADNGRQQDRLRETLTLWLKRVDPAPTWTRLVDAHKSQTVNEYQLAKVVEENHCEVNKCEVARVNYADHLRRLYRDIAPLQMLQWPKIPHYKFVALAMIKQESDMSELEYNVFVQETIRGKADDIVSMKEKVELAQIFDSTKKVILIEGAPGAGKTMLIWHICQEWGRNKLFTQFSIIVLATLRDPAVQGAKSLTDVLLLTCKNQTDAQKVASRMRAHHGRDTLFLFDGWDELPEEQQKSETFFFSELIKRPEKYFLDEASMIVTSRPVSSGRLRQYASRIEIVGFTSSKIDEYFESCLTSEEKQAGALDNLHHTVEDNPLIKSICYLPLNAAIVVYLFCHNNHSLPSTYHNLFQLLVYHCILHHIERSGLNVTLGQHQHPSFDNFPEEIKEPFKQVCKLAYFATKKNMITFSSATLSEFGVTEPLNHLGLMQSVKNLLIHSERTLHHFLHLSLQELLAAYYIYEMTLDDQVKVFKELRSNPRFSAVFGFYAGFTKLQSKEIRDVVAEIVQKERQKSDSEDKTLLVSLMNWLYEAQDQELCHFVHEELTKDQSGQLNKGNGALNLSYQSLKPSDALSVGYFMSTVKTESGMRFCVDLSNCSLQDHHMKFLVKGLSHCRPAKSSSSVEINLSSNRLDAKGINHIADFLKDSELIQALILRKNKLAHSHLLETLKMSSSLIELDISHCSLKEESVRNMLTHNHSLQCLDISSCTVPLECVANGLMQNSACKLKTLHMIYCNYTPDGMRQISEAIQQCNLEELSVGPLLDDCIGPLGNALTTLRSLSLRGEQVTNKGLHTLGEALQKSNSLHTLYLQDFHCVTSEGLKTLGEQLKRNETLEELTMINFRDTSISDGLRTLVTCLEQNCMLKSLKLAVDQVEIIKETVCNVNKNRQPPLKLKVHT